MKGFKKYGINWILTVAFLCQTKAGQKHAARWAELAVLLQVAQKAIFIFLESPHQVDMKNVVKSSKHFYGYFNTLETHSVYLDQFKLQKHKAEDFSAFF